MSTSAVITELHQPERAIRRTRGAYVKAHMDADHRSARYVANQVGISNTALSDRLKGKAPFLADELEAIARTLKLDPIDFYRGYINATENPHQSPDGGATRRGTVP